MAFARAIVHPFVSAVADSGSASLLQPSNWNATHTAAVTGADVGGIPYCPTATTEVTSANLTFGPTAGQGLTVSAGTATTDVGYRYSQTWNNAAVAFTGFSHSISGTATSAAASIHSGWYGGAAGTTMFMELGRGGLLRKTGGVQLGYVTSGNVGWDIENIDNTLQARSTYRIGFTSGSADNGTFDTAISRVSAGIMAVGTGAAASAAGTLRAAALSAGGSDFTVTAVNSVSPTAQNRTITISYGGTTYYISAKTTND